MGNTTKPLTNTEVKQSKSAKKEYNLADGGGLYLRVKPNGTKSWLFNYPRPFTKRRTHMGLGMFPSVSLADARKKAQDCRELLARDIDPRERKAEEERKLAYAHLNTFKHVAENWLKLKEDKSPAYYKKITSRLNLHVFPYIGEIPLHKITAIGVIDSLQPIANQGKMETVDNICGWINEIMVYALNTGLIISNPLTGIKKAFTPPKTTHLPTLKPEELPELTEALKKANIKLITKYLIEWQLHTMVRPREAAEAKWDEIDFEKQLWVIPAEKMKMKRDHTVPLSSHMINLLTELSPLSGHREYLFPSEHNPRKSRNPQTANNALKKMGFKGRLVSHGLRALASTTLNENGFDPEIIEASLAHVDSNSFRAAYNRSEYIERRRTMMQWWSSFIGQADKIEDLPANMEYLHVAGLKR